MKPLRAWAEEVIDCIQSCNLRDEEAINYLMNVTKEQLADELLKLSLALKEDST